MDEITSRLTVGEVLPDYLFKILFEKRNTFRSESQDDPYGSGIKGFIEHTLFLHNVFKPRSSVNLKPFRRLV